MYTKLIDKVVIKMLRVIKKPKAKDKGIDRKTYVMSKEMTEARYDLTPLEHKVIRSLVSLTTKGEVVTENKQIRRTGRGFSDPITLDVEIFRKMIGDVNYSNNFYGCMKKIINDIYDKYLFIQNGKKSTKIRWFYQVTYHDGKGTISVRFSPTLKDHLGFIIDNLCFDKFLLKESLSLKLRHSFRLYELVHRYINTGYATYEVESLASMLSLPRTYWQYKFFKSRVLIPCINDIQKNTSLRFKMREVKEGRLVVRLEFYDIKEVKDARDN
jgi:plasmid replication initiation protein